MYAVTKSGRVLSFDFSGGASVKYSVVMEKEARSYVTPWKTYNLGDDSTKVIVSPRVWSNWPAPLWITLNQRRLNSALHN
ncbi:unnamed protein product [Urochloa humidicola]